MVGVIYTAVLAAFQTLLSPWAILLPLAGVLTGLAFAGPLVAYIATQESERTFPIFYRFAIIPMFLFSGSFYPISQLPRWLQVVVQFVPLYHGVALCRTLALGQGTLAATAVPRRVPHGARHGRHRYCASATSAAAWRSDGGGRGAARAARRRGRVAARDAHARAQRDDLPQGLDATSSRGSSSRSSNLFVVLLVMAPPSQELEPPANPGRFILQAYIAMKIQPPQQIADHVVRSRDAGNSEMAHVDVDVRSLERMLRTTEIVAVLKELMRMHEGDTVKLSFDTAQAHFSDPESGQRLGPL